MGGDAKITPSCVWTSSFRSESSGGVATGEPMKIPMYVHLSKDIYFFSTLITMLPWCPWTLTAFLLTWGSCSHIQVSCWSQSVRRLWKLDSRLKSQFQHTATCQTYSILSTTPKIAGFSTPKQLYMPGGRNCHSRGHSTRWLLRYEQALRWSRMPPTLNQSL